jgi:hypothetical protein
MEEVDGGPSDFKIRLHTVQGLENKRDALSPQNKAQQIGWLNRYFLA